MKNILGNFFLFFEIMTPYHQQGVIKSSNYHQQISELSLLMMLTAFPLLPIILSCFFIRMSETSHMFNVEPNLLKTDCIPG